MATEKAFEVRGPAKVFICAVAVVLYGSLAFAAEKGAGSGLAHYRIFSLKHISGEQGKKYLAEANVGTVSRLPNTNTLLITAQRDELIKASAVLSLVDAEEQFVIKAIFPASEVKSLPSNAQIAAEVGDISIGTFSEPPIGAAKHKAIIDVHEDSVIAIASAGQLEKIISAFKRLRKVRVSAPVAAEPNKPAEPNQPRGSGKIASAGKSGQAETDVNEVKSDELLELLAEAEKMAAEKARRVGQPNEPNAVAIEEAKMRREVVTGAGRIEEAAVRPSEQAKEPNLAAVAERRDKIVAEKPVLEAARERKPKEAAIEIEEPKEAAEPTVAIRRPYEPELIADGNENLELALPEKLGIVDLLDFVGKYLDLDYMYDETDVKGKEVSLRVQGPIKVKELYPLLESVMKFKGFVMTRKVNLVTIRPMEKAAEIDPVIVDPENGKVRAGDVIIRRVFKLKHIDTTNAQNLLTSMGLSIRVTPIPETGTLIVTGYAYRMGRIEELLELVDKPGKPKQFRFRQLRYTMAKTLAPKIKTLAEQLGTISITVAAPSAAVPTPSARRRGESEAAHRARLARERRTMAARPTTPALPTPAKPTVYLEADERTNRILMIGLEEQLAIVNELIDTLDVEQQDLRALRLYEIQYVGAEEVVEKLRELGIINGGAARPTTTQAASRTPPRGPSGRITPGTGGAAEEALVEEPQVVVIESTNSLLVNATPEQHAQIAIIIGYVDTEPEEAAINYIVYPLENQDPEDLAGILNQLIQETVEKTDKAGKVVQTTVRKIEEDIAIIADPKTYSLIVYASKKNQQWISSLIKQLDEYRAQVLLDVTLVEITKNDEFNYDLNIISSFPDLVSTSGLTGVISGEGVDVITSSTIMGKLSGGTDRFIDLQSDGGSGTGFYGDKHINVLLTAMQTKGYGRVLARPKLLVNDNEAGTIKAEEKTYVVREETSYIPGAEPGSTIPVIKDIFEPYAAGIQLDIEPHISKGDQLRLTITLTRSDFRITQEVLDTGKPPDTVTSDVTTVVTVPDGTTIILGGLERLSQSKGGTKVPLLGDIPIIGGLFRSTANTDTQSRLYVFVKAHILRPGEETGLTDIEIVSAKNRAKFEKYETEMQEYEDWPGIKPKPMDPLRILEAD